MRETIKVKRINNISSFGIFTPSEPIIDENLDDFMSGIYTLKNEGFKIRLSKNIFKISEYTAGSIEERASDIHELILDKNVDALIASGTGKNSNQLVEYLDYDLISMAKKPILGFGDFGAILNNITARTGLITFYGPSILGKLKNNAHKDFGILKSEYYGNLLGDTSKAACKILKSGIAEGRTFGGNLTSFVNGVVLSKVPLEYYNDGIFFWEDIFMPPQMIDMYLTALKNAGILERISGMVIGKFLWQDQIKWKQKDAFEMVMDVTKEYDFPILYAPTFGQSSSLENPILPVGVKCKLDTENLKLQMVEDYLEPVANVVMN